MNWKMMLENNNDIQNLEKDQLIQKGIYPESINNIKDTKFFLVKDETEKYFVISGQQIDEYDFIGKSEVIGEHKVKICSLSHENAKALRKHFPFTAPQCLRDSKITIGLGDRLGLATAGHVRLLKDYPVSPVLCQQSIRELNLTGRTYSGVLDDVSWGVYQEGYKQGFGADGDHLKTSEEVKMALDEGFTMITLDCSEHIDNSICNMKDEEVDNLYISLNKDEREYYENKYQKSFAVNGVNIDLTNNELKRIILTYIGAIRFAEGIYKNLLSNNPDVVFELSIDETLTPTLPEAHYIVAAELIDNGVKLDNLAPRFCSEFQKGIDYIGNIEQFNIEFKKHCAIADYFGYKISVHSGSDKFTVFPIVGEETKGRYHLKTAGTNWLEAVRAIAGKNPELYRRIHTFALENINEAKKYYHISAKAENIPDIDKMEDEELPSLMNQIDTRQFLHITYGLILKADNGNAFKNEIYDTLYEYEEEYYSALSKHIGKHLETLKFK